MTYTFGMYCMLRASSSDSACSDFVKSHSKAGFPGFKDLVRFTYEPDQYWHRVATISAHASAMVITGGFDFQTVQKMGISEYEHLSGGEGNILVEFKNGGTMRASLAQSTVMKRTVGSRSSRHTYSTAVVSTKLRLVV